jgi:hypothetical protein
MKFLINIDCLGTYNVEYKQSNFVKINFPEQGEGIYFLAALKIACAQNLKVETHFEFMDKNLLCVSLMVHNVLTITKCKLGKCMN